MKKKIIIKIVSMTLVFSMLVCLKGHAAQKICFEMKNPSNTQGMALGKTSKQVYILRTKESKNNPEEDSVSVRFYENGKLKQEYYVWKPTYKLEKPEHPNGLSYYNSYIYMVAGDNRIFLLHLNEDGTIESRLTCVIKYNNNKILKNKVYGIAHIENGSFLVREKLEDGTKQYGVYKFNKQEKKAREDHVFKILDNANGYNTGQDIGIKIDDERKHVFVVTSNKIDKQCVKNRVLKYRLKQNESKKYVGAIYEKTIDLDRPSTDYSFYEVESVDFSSGGRMYFTGNEKNNERDADKVRYYY